MKKKAMYLLLVTLLVGCGQTVVTPEAPQADTTFVSEELLADQGEWKNNQARIFLQDTAKNEGTGFELTNNELLINQGGVYTVTGTMEGGAIRIDTPDKVNLVLNGVVIKGTTGPALSIFNTEKTYLTIEAGSDNELSDNAELFHADLETNAVIYCNKPLEITGGGNLIVKANYKHAIRGEEQVIVDNGNLQLSAPQGKGIRSVGDLTINGGTLAVLNAEEALESKAVLTVNGGEINLQATDDGMNATSAIHINDGQIYIEAAADGIDSNGPITITGGTIVALGGGVPEAGIDCDTSEFTITGGTILALGGSSSIPSASSSTQPSIILGKGNQGEVIRIEENNQEVISFVPPRNYEALLFSSGNLSLNKDYVVYRGGNLSGGTSLYGFYTGATYDQSGQAEQVTLTESVTNMGAQLQPNGGTPPAAPNGEAPMGNPGGPGMAAKNSTTGNPTNESVTNGNTTNGNTANSNTTNGNVTSDNTTNGNMGTTNTGTNAGENTRMNGAEDAVLNGAGDNGAPNSSIPTVETNTDNQIPINANH